MSSLVSSLLEKIDTTHAHALASSGSATSACRWPWSSPRAGSTPPASTSMSARSRRSAAGSRTSPTCRRADVAGAAARRDSSTPRPTSRSSRSSTRSTSACRRRCARRRTPTCRTSSRRSRRIAKHLHPGMLVVARVDDVSRHDRRSGAADARGDRPQGGQGLLPRLLARARRPGQPDVPDAQRAEGRRRPHARLLEARRRALRHGDRDDRAGQLDPRRRDGQAAREHVPRGQHRPRQRAGADVRPDEHRRVGGGGRGARPSRSASWRSIPGPASAATASRSIRSTCRGRRSRAASTRASSSWPATSTPACRTTSSTRSPRR